LPPGFSLARRARSVPLSDVDAGVRHGVIHPFGVGWFEDRVHPELA
jgi:hypothetical protein